MARKLVDGEMRAELLATFTRKKFSPNTELKISETFIPLSEEVREAHAQKILEIIHNSETEQEILEKVQNMK